MKIYAVVCTVERLGFPCAEFHATLERAEVELHASARDMEEHGDVGAIEIRVIDVRPLLTPAAYCELANDGEGVLLKLGHSVVCKYAVGGCGVVKMDG